MGTIHLDRIKEFGYRCVASTVSFSFCICQFTLQCRLQLQPFLCSQQLLSFFPVWSLGRRAVLQILVLMVLAAPNMAGAGRRLTIVVSDV